MSEATCDYCGVGLGCEQGSPEHVGYWRTQATGVDICDTCLLRDESGRGDLFARRLLEIRGIDLEKIEGQCAGAENVLGDVEICLVHEALHRAIDLHRKGERLAAIEAAQAAWYAAGSLFKGVDVAPDVLGWRRWNRGKTRPRASRRPLLDKWLENELSKSPGITNDQLWSNLEDGRDDSDLYRDDDVVIEVNRNGHERGKPLTRTGFDKRVTSARSRLKSATSN